jgi:hypothetical protein
MRKNTKSPTHAGFIGVKKWVENLTLGQLLGVTVYVGLQNKSKQHL